MECINRAIENNLLADAMVNRLLQVTAGKSTDDQAFVPPHETRAERRARERAEKKAEKRAAKRKEAA